ncbi:hypothetical protein Ddc_17257 [Ditylenchus destructor]|nr:hypothetical protein Ddc_17257 [Ditylenchus destructor]
MVSIIFLVTFCLFLFPTATVGDEDHYHEDPADKYSAQYNEESNQIDSFDLLVEVLKTLHTKILTVQFSGVGFNDDFVRLLNAVDNVLWTGIIRIVNSDFTQLSQDEILNVFRHTIKPESLSLIQNPGLTTDTINKAIKKGIFGCSLAIIGDESDGIRLKPEDLLQFLHRRSCPQTLLTIHPTFVEDGLTKFIEAIIKRFESDTEPVSFNLQLTEAVNLPLLAGSPFKNTATDEYLSHEEFEFASIRKTMVRRYGKEERDSGHY